MFFFPIGCSILALFILFFPIFLLLLFLDVVTFGFERLGGSPGVTVALPLAMLIGSIINIPISMRTVEYSRYRYFGWFQVPVRQEYGLAINLGGTIIPTGVSIYLLFKAPLFPTLLATELMILICKFLTRPVPGRGLAIPMIIPPVLATAFALLLGGDFAPQVAYISGVLGTLIGGDLLNLGRARKLGAGIVSRGGAGVFDGISLVGIFSVVLTAISPPFSIPL